MEFLSHKDDKRCSLACPLLKSRLPQNIYIPTELSVKDPSYPWVFCVGEGPGSDEDKDKRPFVGRSGKLLRMLLRQFSGLQVNIAIGNLCRCRPTDYEGKNRVPTQAEIEYCYPYLLKDIETLKPAVIITLGMTATTALLPQLKGVGQFSVRGRFYESDQFKGIKILPVFHPAHAVRTPSALSPVLHVDLAKGFLYATLGEFFAKCIPQIPSEAIKVLTTVQQLKEAILEVTADPTKMFSFDYETESLLKRGNRLLSLSFANNNHTGYVVLVDHPQRPWSDQDKQTIYDLIRQLLQSPNPKVCHKAQFETITSLDVLGVTPANMVYDTYMMAHFYDTEFQSSEYRDHHPQPISDWLDLSTQISFWFGYQDASWYQTKNLRSNMLSVPIDDLYLYNGKDSILDYRLANIYRLLLSLQQGQEAEFVLSKVNMPLMYAISWMQWFGTPVDIGLLTQLIDDDPNSPISLKAELGKLVDKFMALPEVVEANRQKCEANPIAGRPTLFGRKQNLFSITSNDDIMFLIFDVMGYKPLGEKKSTDKHFLEAHAGTSPVIDTLWDWRKMQKIVGTFLTGLHTSSAAYFDRRIRPDIHQTAVTGRLKESNPNLQQLPRKEEGTEQGIYVWIKRCIGVPAHSGWCIVGVDYSVHEVRCMAIQAHDEGMAAIFKKARGIREDFLRNPSKELYKKLKFEGDTHRQNASMMFNIPIDQVKKEDRQAAKNLSFLVIYAKDPVPTLAVRLGCGKPEAQAHVDKYLGSFSKVRDYFQHIEKFAEVQGYVTSLNKRRRPTYGVFSFGGDFTHAMNVAHNMPVQGVASDICVSLAAYKMWMKIFTERYNWGLFNVIHDAAYILMPIADLEWGLPIISHTMENPGLEEWGIDPNFVPLQVDLDVGLNMADVAEWDRTPEHLGLIKNWLTAGGDRNQIPKSPYA